MILIIYLNVYSNEQICHCDGIVNIFGRFWTTYDDSMRIKLSPKLFNVVFLFLMIGISNHCILEEVFNIFANSAFAIETSHNLDTSAHHHQDTSNSHKHGESHSILAVDVGNKILSFVVLASPLFFLAFFLTSIIYRSFCLRVRKASLSSSNEQHHYLSRFIWSLSIAPQAPPHYLL